MAEDYYKALDVASTASPDEIQKAYRKLARKYHPDMNPDDAAAKKKFQQVQQAYDVLNDAEKRKLYDQFGPSYENIAAGGGGGAHPGGTAGGSPFPFDIEQIFGGRGGPAGAGGGQPGGGGGFNFEGDLGDIFQQFTGGRGGGRRGKRPAPGPARGSDLSAEVTIPFHTAVLGGYRDISVQRGGKNDTLQIKIPAGVDSGKKIRLRGQGEPGESGQPGDLIVTIDVAPHPHFRRQGANLEIRLPVTIGEATLGSTVDVPTPGGVVTLKIPANSSSGRRLRVKGQGVRASTGDAGDLYVELQIKVPETLDEAARAAVAVLDQQYAGQLRDGLAW